MRERALKAGKYAVCGLHPNSLQHHNIIGHTGALEEERRQDSYVWAATGATGNGGNGKLKQKTETEN